MNQTIKKRIEEINNGIVPEGYEKTSFGIFPCDWEKKKLQQICDIFSGGTPSTNIPKYWDGNIAWCVPTDITRNKKYIDSTEKYISQEGLENSSAKIMPVNSILMCSRATIGPRCINRVPMATNQGFKNLVCKKGYYYEFIYYYIEILLNHLLKKSNGSTFLELSKSELDKSKCVIPQLKQEQSRIAEVLMQWDKAIELQEKLIEAYQKSKKYYLNKMFPKKGSNVPEIRFPGFTALWEQRKLGDVGTTYTGLSGKTKEDFGHGSGQFVTYMNVFSNPVGLSDMIEAVEIDDSQNKVLFGDVLFTTSSETPEEVGMSSVWLENAENTYLNSFCFGYRPTIKFNPYYLAYMLRSSSMRKKITFLAQGISRYNISKNKMMDIEIPIPDIEEQKQVGLYFRNLDNIITLHQQKRDKLLKQRKALQQYLLTGIVRV